jgi:hypothetical protein
VSTTPTPPEALTPERLQEIRDDLAEPRLAIADLLDHIDALEDRITALQEQLASHCGCQHDGRGSLIAECQQHREDRMAYTPVEDVLKENQQLSASKTRWREAAEKLEEYAYHVPACRSYGKPGIPCDCGFKEALALLAAAREGEK